MEINELIKDNYSSIVKRGLITEKTNARDFMNKLTEEVAELDEALYDLQSQPTVEQIDAIKEELADVILVALNFGYHFEWDMERELVKKITKNHNR